VNICVSVTRILCKILQEFWAEHYNYSMRGSKPGPLSPMYALFRDNILLKALTEIRAERARTIGVDPEDLPPLQYMYVMKRSPRIGDGLYQPRELSTWAVW
jgi:hypothetical protein